MRSHLVDVLTGEPMEGENEPIVLPNGRVYGSKGLKNWSEKNPPTSDSMIRDPETGEVFSKTSLRKAYVL